jgi:hypothetical protein
MTPALTMSMPSDVRVKKRRQYISLRKCFAPDAHYYLRAQTAPQLAVICFLYLLEEKNNASSDEC